MFALCYLIDILSSTPVGSMDDGDYERQQTASISMRKADLIINLYNKCNPIITIRMAIMCKRNITTMERRIQYKK